MHTLLEKLEIIMVNPQDPQGAQQAAPQAAPLPAPEPRIDTSNVVKLDEGNYERWKLQISLVMRTAELWGLVDGSIPRPTDPTQQPAWDRRDLKAQTIIVTSVGERQSAHIYDCETAKDMFTRLKEANSDHSAVNKNHLYQAFYKYMMKPTQSVVEGFMELQKLAKALSDMGNKQDESAVVTRIITALPPNYESFRRAWDSVPDDKQTMSALLARLRKEELEEQLKAQEEPPANAAAFAAGHHRGRHHGHNNHHRQHGNRNNNNHRENREGKKRMTQDEINALKKRTTCNKCHKVGHWARECRGRAAAAEDDAERNHQQQGHKNNAFMVKQDNNNSDVWYSDSGASQHVSGSMEWYISYEPFKHTLPLVLSDNSKAAVEGKGTVQVEAYIDGVWQKYTFDDVLYIPGGVNLFSEGAMCQKGYYISRDNMGAYYSHSQSKNGGGPEAEYVNGMYEMLFRRPPPAPMQALVCKGGCNRKLVHTRLAHMNPRYVDDTVDNNAATGIEIQGKGTFICDYCHFGKEARQPFPRVENKTNCKPGEIIHADLSGQMAVKSLGGSLLFLLLKDEYSGFRTAYFLKKKNETVECIKTFIAFIENQTGNNVKQFRSDNGTEFVNAEMASFFKEKGIIHGTSAAGCPQSNGRIEREMRTIKDSSRAMLIQSGLHESLWAEAVGTAVYIHNRVLTKTCKENKTAFEAIFGKKPDLRHIRIFGSLAFQQVHNHKGWKGKSTNMILVGYDGQSNKYRLYNESTRQIIIAHDVSFEESYERYVPVTIKHETPALDMHDERKVVTLSDDDDNENDENNRSSSNHADEENAEQQQQEDKHEPSPSSSNNIALDINTQQHGRFQASIPVKGKTKVKLPITNTMVLRDRSQLKAPKSKYPDEHALIALLANVHDEPFTYQEAMDSSEKLKWDKAMNEEMQSHKINCTWVLVEKPKGVKVLDHRWLYKKKRNPDGSVQRYKARLVIKGYLQKYLIDFIETFAGVARFESIRFILAIASAEGLFIMQFDVKTAFLYGNLEETIYMTQPEGFEQGDENTVCLLKKSLYGLKQAPRCWNKRFSTFLKKFNFTPSICDSSVFIGNYKGSRVYLCLYVDDGLLVGENKEVLKSILNEIEHEFEIKTSEVGVFVGIEIDRKEDGSITLGQKGFIKSLLEKFNMTDCKPASVPMQPNQNLKPAENPVDNLPYRQLIGSLLFLSRTTRPDITFAVCKLAQYCTCYDETHWQLAKYILRYLKGTMDWGLEYPAGQQIKLIVYTDASFAGDTHDRKSTYGFACYIGDKCLITWRSKKLGRVALSSTEAEYGGLCAGAKETEWLRRFAKDLGYELTEATPVFIDNQAAQKLSKNPEHHELSKQWDTEYHYTRQLQEEGQIEVEYIPTEDQVADIFTKPLLRQKHEYFKDLMGMKRITKTGQSFYNNMLLFCCVLGLFQGAASISTHNNIPVLWRKSETPVTFGFIHVKLIIQFVNPCEMLTNELIHDDLVVDAVKKCNEIYQDAFSKEIEEMCPKRGWQHVLSKPRSKRFSPLALVLNRPKRFAPLLIIAGILIFHTVVAGMAISATVMASNNAGEISGIKGELRNQHVELQRQIHDNHIMIRNLQGKFNETIKRLMIHEQDYTNFKSKSISTNFAISYITSRLVNGKATIKEANRKWKQKEVYGPLLDYFNVSIPCGDSCPLKYAKAGKCELSETNDKVFLDFTLPSVNTSLAFVEVDPFTLMKRKGNKTCKVKYVGPQNVILSMDRQCVYGVNIKHSLKEDLIVSPATGCKPQTSLPEQEKYFVTDDCVDRQPFDEWDFVQVKEHDNLYHIYCPESEITIDGKTQQCPSFVFTLPNNAKFNINGVNFSGTKIVVEKTEDWDQLLTLKTNWHLQPTVNWTELLDDQDHEIQANTLFKQDLRESTTYSYWTFVVVCIVGAVIVMTITAAVLHKCKPKDHITVYAEPHEMKELPSSSSSPPVSTD